MKLRSEAGAVPARQEAPVLEIPSDSVNEQIVISAALVNSESRNLLLSQVQPDDFLMDEHRATWQALLDMRRRGLAFDTAAFERIVDKTRVKPEYLRELMRLRPTAALNLGQHVEWLGWDRTKARGAAGPLSSLLAALQDPREDPDRVRALARHVASAFDGGQRSRFVREPGSVVSAMMSEVRKRIEGHACQPYGIPGLDFYEDGKRRLVPGAVPGKITLLTGLSGSGKSVTAVNMMLGLARQKLRVAYGAWEFDSPMTLELLAVFSLGWDRNDTMDPDGAAKVNRALTHERLVELEERAHTLSKWVTFIDNPFWKTVGERAFNDRNLDLVQQLVSDTGCDVFVADLWHRCLADDSPAEETRALYRQQAMAAEMGVHVILVHQQRLKDLEGRQDKRPSREGIKGSGAYVEVADTMIGMHRPAQWKRVADDRIEAFILKQRYGPWPLGVELEWDPVRGAMWGGRSIPYDAPGEESSGGDWDTLVKGKRGKGKKNQ